MARIEPKLRTCPFCGSDAHFISPSGSYPPKFVVICNNVDVCEASIGNYSLTKAEAANRWNKRIGAVTATHEGCRYCPVGCNEYEKQACYRGSRCAYTRAKAGVDYDPEEVFEWKGADSNA